MSFETPQKFEKTPAAILQVEMSDFFEKLPRTDETKESDDRAYTYLIEKDSAVLQDIWDSTNDSREVLTKLSDRAGKSLESFGLDLQYKKVSNHIEGYATAEGLADIAKITTPEKFETTEGVSIDMIPGEYKNHYNNWKDFKEDVFMQYRFSGLDEKQISEILDAEQNLDDAKMIREIVRHQLFVMSRNKICSLQNKEFNKIEDVGREKKEPVWDIVEEMVHKKKLLSAKFFGLLQKMRFAPTFAVDKLDDFIDESSKNIKDLFHKSKKE